MDALVRPGLDSHNRAVNLQMMIRLLRIATLSFLMAISSAVL
ncbi:unnamed protein product [[Actinomadura] parvosata subsp. kistnae]|nr:unnamed protein product [Actinomadura parvosata subsp. kistnae]